MKTESNHIQELAQRISRGEEQALTELYRLTYPTLYRYGQRIIEPHALDVLEEVLSDFFLWVAKNHQKIGKIANFQAYMYRSVRQNLNHALIAKQKNKKRYQRYQRRTVALGDKKERSPEQIFISKEDQDNQQKQIQDAIDQLPIYQREALHLRYFEERDYAEIAQLLQTNPQVVRNYVSRAVKGLRKHFSSFSSILF